MPPPQAWGGVYKAAMRQRSRSPRFPMHPSASSQQWLALSAGGGDSKMAHFLTGDEKNPELIYDDDYRSYLMARSHSSGGYRFGRTQGKHVRVHARTALSRVNGFLKNTIEAIATAKLRR